MDRRIGVDAVAILGSEAVLVLIDETTATIIDRTTGEILATCTIDPNRTYWRNNEREPGRWPSSRTMNDDAGHL